MATFQNAVLNDMLKARKGNPNASDVITEAGLGDENDICGSLPALRKKNDEK